MDARLRRGRYRASAGSVLLAVSHRDRGIALRDAREQLRRALIDQARSERLLRSPGHRKAALALLRQASDIGASPEIRDEAVALLAQGDVSPVSAVAEPADPVPPAWSELDPILSAVRSADGKWTLAFHTSGRASLGRTGAPEPLRSWSPAESRAAMGNFSPDGKSAILAETDKGMIAVSFKKC